MAHVVKLARQIAPSDASVLITGESGTGKQVLAPYVHLRSSCSRGAFISVNCAAIPENLLESELLGHEKGARSSTTALTWSNIFGISIGPAFVSLRVGDPDSTRASGCDQ
jgi:DNA-binding NtrC family response regulator